MESDMVGKMVMITDVHEGDARYMYRDKMIGMVVKVIRVYRKFEGDWYGMNTNRYQSQWTKIYGDKDGGYGSDTWDHYGVRIKVLSSDPKVCLDVDSSTAKRMRKYLDDDTICCEELKGTVYHWSIYRHVEMMDKHLESRLL